MSSVSSERLRHPSYCSDPEQHASEYEKQDISSVPEQEQSHDQSHDSSGTDEYAACAHPRGPARPRFVTVTPRLPQGCSGSLFAPSLATQRSGSSAITLHPISNRACALLHESSTSSATPSHTSTCTIPASIPGFTDGERATAARERVLHSQEPFRKAPGASRGATTKSAARVVRSQSR